MFCRRRLFGATPICKCRQNFAFCKLIKWAFSRCTDLTDITFQGTMQQWNNISKGTDWNYNTGSYTITCTDGVLDKDGQQIS